MLPAGGAGLKALGIESQLLRDGILFGVLGGVHTGFEQDWSKPLEAGGKTLLGAGLNAMGGAVAGKVNEGLLKAIFDEWNGVGSTTPEFVSLPPETPKSDTSLPELVKDWNGDYNNIGDTIDNRPYLNPNSRPSFRDGVVESTWNNAKDPDGLVRDPNTGDVINWTPGQSRKGIWDMGHIPGQKYYDMFQKYLRGEMTPKQFRDWYNNPNNYRPEIPHNNRGHLYE